MYRTAYNSTASPVVVDDEGRTIGGREWGTYDTTQDAAKRALDAGALLPVDRPEDESGADPRALAAFARTEEIAERYEQARALDRETLAPVAEPLVAEPEPTLTEMREAVAQRPEVALPEAPRKTTTARKTARTEA